MRILTSILLFFVAALNGCVAPPKSVEPAEPVVDDTELMTYIDAELRPETILFPEYLLMEGFELDRHGRIPGSSLVGVGLKTKFPLAQVRRDVSQIMKAHDWITERTDIGGSSFRVMASLKLEKLEVRAVQGSGETQVFIVYTPAPQ